MGGIALSVLGEDSVEMGEVESSLPVTPAGE